MNPTIEGMIERRQFEWACRGCGRRYSKPMYNLRISNVELQQAALMLCDECYQKELKK